MNEYSHTLEEDLQITTEVCVTSVAGVSLQKSVQRSGLKTVWEFAFLNSLVRLNTSTKS